MDDPQPNPAFARIDENGALIDLVFDDAGLPDGHSLVPLPDDYFGRPYRWADGAFDADIDHARAALWEEVKAKRFAIEDGGCPTPLGRMDSDPESRLKLTGAVTMAVLSAQASAPFNIDWTMSNNKPVSHDGPAIIAAGMAMGAHVATAHAVATALRGQIEACDTFKALDAIDIEAAPWPGEKPNGG